MTADDRPAFFSDAWFRVADLRLALRPGLRAARQRFRGRPWYVVHDPVRFTTHRLTPEAWLFLSRLDGHRSLEAVWQQVVEELGPRAPGQTEALELLAQLHAAGLVRSDRAEDVAHLVAQRRRQHKPLWLRNLANPLSVRVPLWNCDPLLARLAPAMQRLLTPWAAVLWLAWVLPALWLAAQHGQALTGNLSDRLLAPAHLLLLMAVFAAVKCVHELAHGLVARALGAPVHEMGVMFLVLAPVPYVDASAANALRSRVARALVGAAGMLAELALAAAALYLWLLVEPGPLRAVLHDVVLVAGVSTVVFNANPLLRFDGYYILSDLLEIPNLATRANADWMFLLRRRLLGDRSQRRPDATPGERVWLLLYAPASLAYRLGLTLAIAFFVADRYFFVGVALGVLAVVTTVVWPLLRGLFWLATQPGQSTARGRAAMAAGLVGLPLVLLATLLPLPARVHGQGVVWSPPCTELRAAESGFVGMILVANGQPVAVGTPLVQLQNPELAARLEAQAARVQQLAVQAVAERNRERARGALADDQLQQERRVLDDLERRVQALTLRACDGGEVQIQHAVDRVGAWVTQGDLLGHVQRSDRTVVRVVIDQDDIGRVRRDGGPVDLMLADRLGAVLPGRVLREVPGGEARLPSAALSHAGGGPHAVDPADAQQLTTLRRVFQVDVVLDQPLPDARTGIRAHARFDLPPEPLARQWGRRLRQLLLSRLDV